MNKWVLYSKIQSDNYSTKIEGEWNYKPSIDEITKITHDPQMSIALVRGSGVTRGVVFYFLEDPFEGNL